MKLFDDVIEKMLSLLPESADKAVAYDERLCADNGDKNAILFRSDTAFELGGNGKPGIGSVLFGDLSTKCDEVVLYGSDLDEITQDSPFAHLSFVQLKQHDETDVRYEQLKNIGFTVFQLYPKGYYIRISPSGGKEQVRVAKDILQKNLPLSFLNVGCSLIRKFKEHPDVEFVKTVFITKSDFDYNSLSNLATKAKNITDAVQGALEWNSLDCSSCKMKPICDEVEGLRELHFRKEKEKH